MTLLPMRGSRKLRQERAGVKVPKPFLGWTSTYFTEDRRVTMLLGGIRTSVDIYQIVILQSLTPLDLPMYPLGLTLRYYHNHTLLYTIFLVYGSQNRVCNIADSIGEATLPYN